MEKHLVAEGANLAPGKMMVVTAGRRSVILANVDGELKAVGSVCAHQGGPLANGRIFDEFSARVEDGEIKEFIASKQSVIACPWHGWEYDLRTGECLWNKKYRIATYRVETGPDGEVSVYV